MTSEPADLRFVRRERTLWRLCGLSVLTQAIDGGIESASTELTGWAARVWVALDEPATLDEVCARLGATLAAVEPAIHSLLEGGHVQLR